MNKTEAATVRMIFERFAQMGSARALARTGHYWQAGTGHYLALAQMGWHMRSCAHSRPRALPASAASRSTKATSTGCSTIAIYVGEAVHKGMYPGKHKAIISRALWNKVHKISSGVDAKTGVKKADN